MRTTRMPLSQVHWPLVAAVALIALLGVYNLHSSAAAHDPRLWWVQLTLFGVGLVLVAGVLLVDYRVTEGLAYPLYALVCALLMAVLMQGKIAKGAQRWLELGPLTFQPSELAKLATILCLARYLAQRVEPGGFSMRDLFRPLNPSRPIAALVALVVAWKKPVLSDPVGELARFIHNKLGGNVPELGDLLWFRVSLLVAVVGLLGAGVLVINNLAHQRALLDPWPPRRRLVLIVMWSALMLGVGIALASSWSTPALRDPFGVLIAKLVSAAAPGGRYATLQSGVALRATLSVAVVAYLAAAVLHVRASRATWIDLMIAPIDLLALPGLLVLVEPDLGTAGVIVLIGLTMILVAGVRLRSLIIMGLLSASVAVVGWFGILKDYQKLRILMLIDPDQDRKGAGWNVVQSLIAVGSGRWTGKGHLEGTQSQLSFLPEQHTDFAFSVWAEEQGFLGCALVLGLYLALLLIGLAIAAEARDTYGALLSSGVVALVLWHTLVNVGMVTGLLPVVGITLPLFSYGGSSLLSVMGGVGLLLNVRLHRRPY